MFLQSRLTIKLIFLLFIAHIFISCSAKMKKQDTRNPSSSEPQVAARQASLGKPWLNKDHGLTDKEKTDIENWQKRHDVNALTKLLRQLRQAQVLTSSFDARLKKMKTAEELERLMNSTLYCKIWEARSITLAAENRLLYALSLSVQENHVSWIFNEIIKFSKESKLNYLSAGQNLRLIKMNSVPLCDKENCLKEAFELIDMQLPGLMDDNKFLTFKKDNIRELERWTTNKNDLIPGKCNQSPVTRKPNQDSYDWKNRNWIGSILAPGEFVFTYDDGPHPVYTKDIMRVWENQGLEKPSFFWLSEKVESLYTIVQEANLNGYVIGSHSINHPDLGNIALANKLEELSSLNKHQFAQELKDITPDTFDQWKQQKLDSQIIGSVDVITNIIHQVNQKYLLKNFRLPYGSGVRNDLIGLRFQNLNVEHFFWRVDSLDWQDKNPSSILERVTNQMKLVTRGIVLFHDVHPQSVEAAQLLTDFLKNQEEWKAVSISKLVPQPELSPIVIQQESQDYNRR